MSRCKCTLLLAAALAGLAGVGCAAERVEPTAMEATFPPIDGERLLPLAPRAMRVRVVEGPNAGDELDYQVQRADDGDHWLFTLEGAQRVYLRRNDAGETVVFREDDMQEGVAVHYEPALLLLPARLDPAEALPAQTVDVTVRRLDTGQVRDRGTCDYRIARVTHETDDDEQRYRIVQRREIDLNLASATVTIEAVHVPDRGRIAWSVERRTRIFGLLGSDRHERYEVIERVERTPRR